MKKHPVAVIGAGSWATALASLLSQNGRSVAMWSRSEEVAEEINRSHMNAKYLSDVRLSDKVYCSTSLKEVVNDASQVLLVVPSHALREVVRNLKPHLKKEALLIHATKGLEIDTRKRMSEVIADELSPDALQRVAVLSGPSHAEEVARQSPTTVVVASENARTAQQAQDLLMTSWFRVYTNPDVVGVEVGGSMKNIIALGVGLSNGLGFGDNAKAALMTRGLAEIRRLGVELGADPLTFSGLAGVGDLIVTCTSQLSRNWRAGHMLGKGIPLEEVLQRMGMVVEGVKTTKAAYAIMREKQVEMPITYELYQVLFNNKPVKEAVEDLMGRVRKHEVEPLDFTNVPYRS